MEIRIQAKLWRCKQKGSMHVQKWCNVMCANMFFYYTICTSYNLYEIQKSNDICFQVLVVQAAVVAEHFLTFGIPISFWNPTALTNQTPRCVFFPLPRVEKWKFHLESFTDFNKLRPFFLVYFCSQQFSMCRIAGATPLRSQEPLLGDDIRVPPVCPQRGGTFNDGMGFFKLHKSSHQKSGFWSSQGKTLVPVLYMDRLSTFKVPR